LLESAKKAALSHLDDSITIIITAKDLRELSGRKQKDFGCLLVQEGQHQDPSQCRRMAGW
jgi:hypothetical protein